LGHGVIDTIVAGVTTATGVGAPLAIRLLGDAGIDTSISIYKTMTKIYPAAKKASRKCEKKCCPLP